MVGLVDQLCLAEPGALQEVEDHRQERQAGRHRDDPLREEAWQG